MAPIEMGDDAPLRDALLGGIGEDFFPFKILVKHSMADGKNYLRLIFVLRGSPEGEGWRLDPGDTLLLPTHDLKETYRKAESALWGPLAWETPFGGTFAVGGNPRKALDALLTLCDSAAPLFYEADPRIGMIRPPKVPFFDGGAEIDKEFGKPCPICGALTDPPGSTSKWGGWNLGVVHTYCL